MALTNQQKMARRRAKLNSNPELKKAYLEKDRLRKIEYRTKRNQKMTAYQLKQFKLKECERMKNWYKMKKQKSKENVESSSSTEQLSTVYKSRQALGKALKKVTNNLPKSAERSDLSVGFTVQNRC